MRASRPAPRRVLVAPDSFKGSYTAVQAAAALAEGWGSRRSHDDVTTLPQADGGEGTIDAIAAVRPDAVVHWVDHVSGPDLRHGRARWLELPEGTAVIELAESSGLPSMRAPAPGRATSRGLGEVMAAALRFGVDRLLVGLGGSASTDGGGGALSGLGCRLLDGRGRPVRDGGLNLLDVAEVRLTGLVDPPVGGVELLCDTCAVLTGATGAARVFGPQKGANAAMVDLLDRALTHWSEVLARQLPTAPHQPGSGAAGGVGFGLAAWGAVLVPGAATVAALTGLDDALASADILLTGEGQYDLTSTTGKLVGDLTDRARGAGVTTIVVAGRVRVPSPPGVTVVDLTELAGSTEAAMTDPGRWLRQAAAEVASSL